MRKNKMNEDTYNCSFCDDDITDKVNNNKATMDGDNHFCSDFCFEEYMES